MKLVWQVESSDVERTRAFVGPYRDHPGLRARIARNLQDDKPPVPIDVFWRAVVGSLLSSSQRRGQAHPVSQFLRSRPFPLDLAELSGYADPFPTIELQLKLAGGLGRSHVLVDQLTLNLQWLLEEGGPQVKQRLEPLRRTEDRDAEPDHERDRQRDRERETAEWLDRTLKGFGPRQARHLLQMLGLTRYEIPLDAPLIRWLNRLAIRPPLSAAAISERGYYLLVQDGVQQLCAACQAWPCELHAAVLVASGIDDEGTCW